MYYQFEREKQMFQFLAVQPPPTHPLQLQQNIPSNEYYFNIRYFCIILPLITVKMKNEGQYFNLNPS